MPRFVASANEDGIYIIEKWSKGKYIVIDNEKYFTIEQAKERAEELNRQYNEYE